VEVLALVTSVTAHLATHPLLTYFTTHPPLTYLLSALYLLRRDVVGAPEDSDLRRRLKCICSLANPADIKVDKVAHGRIAQYNAKP